MANSNLDRCLAYLDKLPHAVSGSGGHDATLRAACEVVRFGLTPGDEWTALEWYNANRCDPVWSEKELQHKLADAHRKAVHGERTAATRWGNARPTIKPVTAAELRALSAARQSQKSEHGGRVESWPVPAYVADFLRETGNTITARNGAHGERLTVAPVAGRSLFDELTAFPEPTIAEAKADRARSIAAAAIREGVPCLTDGDRDMSHDDGPEGWRAYADRWGGRAVGSQ